MSVLNAAVSRQLARFFALAVLLVVPIGMHAQEFRATISGTVTDNSDAVVPHASVVVTNMDTGGVTRLQSNDSGAYAATSLTPGRYSVHVEAPNFQSVSRNGITLQAGDHPQID